MKKIQVILIIVFLLSISACAEKNPKLIAQGYAIKKEADSKFLTEQQNRDIQKAEQEYWQGILDAAYPGILIALYLFVISLGITASLATPTIAFIGVKAFSTFAMLRAGTVPIDRQTRLPRDVFIPRGEISGESTGLLGNFIQAINVRKTHWIVMKNTGEVLDIDITQPYSNLQIELVRQVILNNNTSRRQQFTGAEQSYSIGKQDISMPSPNLLIDLTEVKSQTLDALKAQIEFDNQDN